MLSNIFFGFSFPGFLPFHPLPTPLRLQPKPLRHVRPTARLQCSTEHLIHQQPRSTTAPVAANAPVTFYAHPFRRQHSKFLGRSSASSSPSSAAASTAAAATFTTIAATAAAATVAGETETVVISGVDDVTAAAWQRRAVGYSNIAGEEQKDGFAVDFGVV